MTQDKIFGFIKKVFVVAITFYDCNVLNVNPMKCIFMNNRERKIRPKIISVNSDEPLLCYSVLK